MNFFLRLWCFFSVMLISWFTSNAIIILFATPNYLVRGRDIYYPLFMLIGICLIILILSSLILLNKKVFLFFRRPGILLGLYFIFPLVLVLIQEISPYFIQKSNITRIRLESKEKANAILNQEQLNKEFQEDFQFLDKKFKAPLTNSQKLEYIQPVFEKYKSLKGINKNYRIIELVRDKLIRENNETGFVQEGDNLK